MERKIRTREEIALICGEARRRKKKVGFTSGVFDLVHAGHAACLGRAAEICDLLVVGVNSDSSVRRIKGETRPVFGEDERMAVVAAFEAVDYVFLFEEERNEKNIRLLKPDYYIKADDYSRDSLTSAKIVESLGGEVRIIKKEYGASTSAAIRKILSVHGPRVVTEGKASHITMPPAPPARAVFLDRDGTINRDTGYFHEPGRLEFLPNALEGIKKMQEMGFKIVIVTNQAGIGLGYFTKEDFYGVNREMLGRMRGRGISVSKIYFCPHSAGEGCGCRKPGTGLIELAASELGLDLSACYLAGDAPTDIEAGRKAGTRTILISPGGKPRPEEGAAPDYLARDLLEAADYIERQESIQSR